MSVLPNRKFDLFSKGAVYISSDHSRIHDGVGYHLDYKAAAIAAGADRDVLLQVPMGTWAHLRLMNVYADDTPWDLVLYEGPTWSTAGTVIPTYNLQRSSSNVSAITCSHSPTVSVPGTALDRRFIPDTTAGGAAAGGSTSPAEIEWVLNQGTDYLIRQTNGAGAGSAVSLLELFWYEPSSDVNVI